MKKFRTIKYQNLICYLTILLISLIPSIILINKGFIKGHDNEFHYAQIKDLYDSFKSGHFSFFLNYETANYLGMGVRLMYGSFSHIITAAIGLIICPFGFSLTFSMKIVMFMSIFLSGIFTFKFTRRLTNNNLVSIISSSIYMLFPYRFCLIYVRNAYAETVALTFIPLVFLGMYDVLKSHKNDVKPFLEIIIGISLLLWTHNITALFTVIFVVIYALFYIDDIKLQLKEKNFFIKTIVSIIFILSLGSILLLPMLESKKANLYRVFDSEAMRTNITTLKEAIDSSLAYLTAGLNFNYKNNMYSFILLSITSYLTYYFVMKLLKDRNENNIIRLVLSSLSFLVCIILSVLINVDYIVWLGLLLTSVLYFIPYYPKILKTEVKYNEIISFLVLIIITLLLIGTKTIWDILPEFLYNIQFPWRLWGTLGFFIAIIIALVLNNIKISNYLKYACCLIIGISIVIIKPISINEYNYNEEYCWSEEYSITEKYTYNIYSAGWQLEYFTTSFLEGSKSAFWWNIYSNYLYNKELGEAPLIAGILDGQATVSNYEYNEGVITFHLECSKESLIEVARVYYKGYKVLLKDENGNIYNIDCFENESYVAFKTDLSGDVTIYYNGTVCTKLGTSLTFISLICYISIVFYLSVKKYYDLSL